MRMRILDDNDTYGSDTLHHLELSPLNTHRSIELYEEQEYNSETLEDSLVVLLQQGDDKCSVSSLETDTVPRPRPQSAYLLLTIAVVSLSSIGPLLVLQHDATPTMKVVWRMTGTSMLLLPLATYDIYTHGVPHLTLYQWSTFLVATVCYGIMTLSFVIALDYTSIGNAVVLANSLPLMFLVGRLFRGEHVTWKEGCGAIVALGGAALCANDSANVQNEWEGGSDTTTTTTTTIVTREVVGASLALLSALGGVGYLVFAKTSRSHMPMYLFMVLTMALGAGLAWIVQRTILGEATTFDMDYHHGFWGFLLPQKGRLGLELVIVVVCNVCGTMGYVRVMQYFDNLVISSAALMEPVVAEFLAFGFGVGALPGMQGWIGNALVAGGTFAILYEDAKEMDKGTSASTTAS